LFISLHNANQSVRGSAPIKMNSKWRDVFPSRHDGIMMSLQASLTRASTTLECTCTDVLSRKSEQSGTVTCFLARESLRTSMVTLRAYLESTSPPVQPTVPTDNINIFTATSDRFALRCTVVYASAGQLSMPGMSSLRHAAGRESSARS